MTRVAALVVVMACGQKAEEARRTPVAEEPYRGAWSPRPAPAAEVVAEVNGEAIWDTDVGAYAAAHGLTARAALDELVALELVAQEARRRGLSEDPEVVEVRRRERVRRLVDGFAAQTDSPDEIPEADVDKVWSRPEVQRALNHPEQHEVVYVRVPVTKKDPPAWTEEARQQAEAVRRHLLGERPATADDFKMEASVFYQQRTGKKLQTEKALLVDSLTNFVVPFKQAALALKTPGDLSPVVRTQWGWDLLYLVRVIPPLSTSRAEAAPEIRRRVHEDWRRFTFGRWLEAFMAAARVVRHDPALAQVEVDSTFGLP